MYAVNGKTLTQLLHTFLLICCSFQYFTITFLIFVVVLIGGILGFVFREKVQTTMKQEMLSSLKFYGNKRTVTQSWDTTQERLKCCGVDNFRDWQLFGRIPESCCQETYGGQKKPCVDNPSQGTLYNQGCLHVTSTFIRDNASIVAGCSIFLTVLMVSHLNWNVNTINNNLLNFFSFLEWYSHVHCSGW